LDSFTNSERERERVLRGSLYCLTFVTGLVDAGSYVAMGGFLAGKLDSWLGKGQRNRWLAAALAIETLLLFAAMTVSWHFRPLGGQRVSVALYGAIALTALGMGRRNGTSRRLAVPELTTTVLTLTVAALVFDFSLAPGSNPRWRRRVGSILMMFSGAYVGVQLLKHSLAFCSRPQRP
jgi:uncharacterized membrane protein YoaK (UPF0700 family)